MSKAQSFEKESIKIGPNIVRYDTIKYQLNDADKTASVIGYRFEKGDLFIPRSIYYESQEYIVSFFQIIIMISFYKDHQQKVTFLMFLFLHVVILKKQQFHHLLPK